jgi:hypothetical protein
MGSSVSHSSYQMSQRQPSHRLSQILDPDVLPSTTSSWSTSTLGRSASLAGMARARHGNQLPPDDVESAFVDLHSNGGDGNTRTAAQQSPPSQQSFYNSSITYQPSNVSTNESHRPPLSEQQSYSLRRSTTGMMSQSQQQPCTYSASFLQFKNSAHSFFQPLTRMALICRRPHPITTRIHPIEIWILRVRRLIRHQHHPHQTYKGLSHPNSRLLNTHHIIRLTIQIQTSAPMPLPYTVLPQSEVTRSCQQYQSAAHCLTHHTP